MKKFLLIVSVALALTSCNKTDYKAVGEQYAKQLIDLCQKNDTAAVLALNDSIRAFEQQQLVNATPEDADAFYRAMSEARDKSATFITVAKMESGGTKEDAVQDVINDALNGGGNISTVTRSVQAANEVEKKQGKAPVENENVRRLKERAAASGTH